MMVNSSIVKQERARLRSLKSYSILNTQAESEYDAISKIAAQICGTPIAYISLVDKDSLWFKSFIGSDTKECPREGSLCNEIIKNSPLPTVVEDTTKDERFKNNFLVVGEPYIRFCAGAPLIDKKGNALGTICVLDIVNKQLSQQQVESLQALAKQVMSLLELRKKTYELEKRNRLLVQKKNEVNLENAKFKMLFHQASVGIGLIDVKHPQLKFAHVNQAMSDIFGYTTNELMDIALIQLSKRSFIDEAIPIIQALLLPETVESQLRTRFIKKDGSVIWCETLVKKLKDAPMAVVIIKDVSTEEVAHQKLLKSKQRLEESQIKLENRNREMEQFVFVASHDLQEPLRTINSVANILQDDLKEHLTPDLSNYLSFLDQATDRMKELILSLLVHLRLGKGEELSNINLNHTLKDVLNDMDESIRASHAEIRLQELPTIKGYPIILRQLFLNLISNAIRFSKKDTLPIIEISHKEDNDAHCFCIKDNGIGIPPQYKDKVFVIFQRLNPREAYKGIGIGLANCKKIAHQHKGDIWVESDGKEGSKFFFTISKRMDNG